MGENFLKQQVRNFTKGRDRAAAELGKPTLFDRPEVVNTVYTAEPAKSCQFQSGETLLAVATEDGQSAVLARGFKSVGRIDGDSAKSLLFALRDPTSAGVVPMKITEVSGLSGVAKIVIDRGK